MNNFKPGKLESVGRERSGLTTTKSTKTTLWVALVTGQTPKRHTICKHTKFTIGVQWWRMKIQQGRQIGSTRASFKSAFDKEIIPICDTQDRFNRRVSTFLSGAASGMQNSQGAHISDHPSLQDAPLKCASAPQHRPTPPPEHLQ